MIKIDDFYYEFSTGYFYELKINNSVRYYTPSLRRMIFALQYEFGGAWGFGLDAVYRMILLEHSELVRIKIKEHVI